MAELVFKLAGAACIMGAAIAYGELKARNLELRVKQLQQFQRSLKLLAAEISYARSVLPDAFKIVGSRSDYPVSELYLAAARLLLSPRELSARQAWQEAVRQLHPNTAYTAADREIIESLGVSLGVSQHDGQLKQVLLTGQHLDFALEGARDNRERHARLWRYLGFIGGAALVILLL
jgi:stage III sporulation protein AB